METDKKENADASSEVKVDSNCSNNANLLAQREQLISLLQSESNGIWSRFNILIGVQLACFTGMVHLITSEGKYIPIIDFKILVGIISFVGFILSLGSVFILNRLWKYHQHWKDNLTELEKSFPADWVRPFYKIEDNVKIKTKIFSIKYIQLSFPIIFIIAWAVFIMCAWLKI